MWGEGVVNGGGGLLLIVHKYRGANTLEVTDGVERAVDDLQPGLPGIAIDTTIFRPATFIEQSIDNLTTALLLGVALVILIIVAFLLEWRTAFISLIAIPLSLISAVLVLELGDRSINVMVLAGLVVAIGVVVDDAIIDVENIVRRLRQARGGEQQGVDVPSRARRLGRGAQRDHLRDGDQRRRDRAGLPAPGTVRLVLPAAGAVVRARGARVDARRAHRHAGAVPPDAVQGTPAARRLAAAARAEARLYGDPPADHPPAESVDRGGRECSRSPAS